jgi:hypothetical protein
VPAPGWYCRPRMQAPSRSSLDPAGAGGTLLLGIGICIGLGALLGWLAGSLGIGILIGAAVGIPVGIYAVYRRYGGAA